MFSENFRKYSLWIIILGLLLIPQVAAAAAGDTEFIIGQKTYLSDGASQTMDVSPFIKNGRTLVPLRYLALSIGVAPADILWDAAAMRTTLSKGGHTVVLTIGSSELSLDGTTTKMDIAPLIDNQRIFLPARYVAEAFGFSAKWDASRQAVKISTAVQPVLEVRIKDSLFTPGTVTVHVGDAITWQNQDSVPHTATGTEFDSGRLNQGESFTFLFSKEGSFDYTCTFHPMMKGKVIVLP